MNTTTPTETVRTALATTRRALPEHWARCLAQRAMLTSEGAPGATACGSRYYATPHHLEALLEQVAWEPYEHPAVLAGCRAFRAWLPGFLGVAPVARLEPGALVEFRLGKDGTYAEPVLLQEGVLMPAAFTVLIVGDEGPAVGEVVFTFHPGEPIAPFRHETYLAGKFVPVAVAARLSGVTHVKLP